MRIHPTDIPGVLRLEPRLFRDDRGFFYEAFNADVFGRHAAEGLPTRFVQDNHSRSTQRVLRGLHYQLRQPQGKLIMALVGEIFDVAVDLRRSSPTFGKWTSATLSGGTHRALWIPPGFAHGFLVLSEQALIHYKASDYYAPEHERTVLWNDPDLAIAWPLEGEPILADKDRRGVPLQAAETFT